MPVGTKLEMWRDLLFKIMNKRILKKLLEGFKMYMKLNRGNEYFDTYYIYNEEHKKVGIIEDHKRQVKKQYFVGWKIGKIIHGLATGTTQYFDNIEDAMIFSVGTSDIKNL